MTSREIGIAILAVGVLLVLLGALFMTGALGWIGRLPGDLRFERGRTRVFVPIGTMIILSILLTLLLNFIRRFL